MLIAAMACAVIAVIIFIALIVTRATVLLLFLFPVLVAGVLALVIDLALESRGRRQAMKSAHSK